MGIFVFGTLKASVPALVVALAQEAAPAGSAGAASGIIMSLHYTSGVVAPLIAARLITGTGDIVLAMILVSAVPLVLYGSLISAVQERKPYLPTRTDLPKPRHGTQKPYAANPPPNASTPTR